MVAGWRYRLRNVQAETAETVAGETQATRDVWFQIQKAEANLTRPANYLEDDDDGTYAIR